MQCVQPVTWTEITSCGGSLRPLRWHENIHGNTDGRVDRIFSDGVLPAFVVWPGACASLLDAVIQVTSEHTQRYTDLQLTSDKLWF